LFKATLALTLVAAGGLAVAASQAPRLGAATGARATMPGRNGKIAFETIVGDNRQIGVVNANGTGWRLLTNTTDADNQHADWSPDGKRIVFERDVQLPGQSNDLPPILNLYVMNANGSNAVALTHYTTVGGAEAPSWTPDGKRIVFDTATVVTGKCCSGAIYTMAPDGTDVQQMTPTSPTGIYDAQESPDGRRVAYMRFLPPDYKAAIFVSKTDGSGERQLTEWGLDANSPDWAPNGTRIAFSSAGNYNPKLAPNVFTIRPDGTGLKQLTHNPPGAPESQTNAPRSYSPSWSPDGKRIAFARTPGADKPDEFADIFSMRADGKKRRLVTRTTHWQENPDWGPRYASGF
jgi:TolB protein